MDEGKSVCVALRDTPLNNDNPCSLEQRRAMFEREFGDTVKVIVIPDIAEVCYGRGVGWRIREIRLDPETESISATEIRRDHRS